MALRFLPGTPTKSYSAVDVVQWDNLTLTVYCSGNNLIIIENGTQLVQTIYLPSDGLAVAIDSVRGHIAVSHDTHVTVLEPIKSFEDPVKWVSFLEIEEPSSARAISWGNGELLVGSDRLSLWSMELKAVVWEHNLGGPVKFCCFSPDARLFCTFGFDDHLVKLWRRSSFDAANLSIDFDYIQHSQDLLSVSWLVAADAEVNVLFTFTTDRVLRVWAPTAQGPFGLWGSIYCDDFVPAVINRTMLPSSVTSFDNLTNFIILIKDTRVSVYTLRNIGALKQHKLAKIECLVQAAPVYVKTVERLPFRGGDFRLFAQPGARELELTFHSFRGVLCLASVPYTQLFDARKRLPRVFTLLSNFTGHTKSIQKISRDSRGDTLLTQTRFSETQIWKMLPLHEGTTLSKASHLDLESHLSRAVVNESILVGLADQELVIWDIQPELARKICSTPVENAANCLALFHLPTSSKELHYVGVYPSVVQIWKYSDASITVAEHGLPDVRGRVLFATPVDPVHAAKSLWGRTLSSGLVTVTDNGIVQCWSLSLEGARLIWQQTSQFSVDEPKTIVKIQMSYTKELAIAQPKRLIIWSTVNQLVEMDKTVNGPEAIKDLDWTSTPTGESLLGVGYSTSVVIYCQQRYDYSRELESWMPIRVIDISSYTSHEIGDSIWLKDGTFVIGAGNQLFIQDCHVDMTEPTMRAILQVRNTISAVESASTIFDISAVLNGPLAVYHPQLIIQMIFLNRVDVAIRIFMELAHQIKFGTVTSLLGFDPLHLMDAGEPVTTFTSSAAADLEESVQKVVLPYLTRHQQVTLLGVIQTVKMLVNQLNGVDASGLRYLLGYELFLLHQERQESMMPRDFAWGWFSESKAMLLQEVSRKGPLKWPWFRKTGLPYWLELETLVEQTELLAQRQFAASRDPVQVSLYYLALRKKKVLVGLWRVSSGHPEQSKTLKLLSQNFDDPAKQTVAKRNAYALLSKHRYEYAAALFLLGESPVDACDVLIRHVRDPALAVLVARLYQGDSGPAMQALAAKHFSDDSWTRCWASWMVGRYDEAVESCRISRVTRAENAQLQRMEDPVLTIMYRHIRHKSAETIGDELELLKRTALIYSRMGCDLVGMDLMRTWKFKELEASGIAETTADASTKVTALAPTVDPGQPDMSAFEFGF